MKDNCPKCSGFGYVGHLQHKLLWYKIVCPRCHGKRKLDWIERALPPVQSDFMKGKPGHDALTISFSIKKHMPPDDYTFVFGGTTYFMKEAFFVTRNVHEQWKNLIMNLQFMKENPGTLDIGETSWL